jgi:hypothetical protein
MKLRDAYVFAIDIKSFFGKFYKGVLLKMIMELNAQKS